MSTPGKQDVGMPGTICKRASQRVTLELRLAGGQGGRRSGFSKGRAKWKVVGGTWREPILCLILTVPGEDTV